MLKKSFFSWYISTHSLSSSSLDNKLSCYHSLIHGSSCQSLSPLNFTPIYFPLFPNTAPWLSSSFNSLPFNNSSLSQNTHSSIPFHQSLLQSLVHNTNTTHLDLQINTSIINSHHSIREPQLVSSNPGIPFQDELHITHIRAPQSSEILTLYNLHHLIPLYHSVLSESISRQLVLHIIPSSLV